MVGGLRWCVGAWVALGCAACGLSLPLEPGLGDAGPDAVVEFDAAPPEDGDTAMADAGASDDATSDDAASLETDADAARVPDAFVPDAYAIDASRCVEEICSNAIDDDCDGFEDEGCGCDAYVYISRDRGADAGVRFADAATSGGTGGGSITFGDGTHFRRPARSIAEGLAALPSTLGTVCIAVESLPFEDDCADPIVIEETLQLRDGQSVVGGYTVAASGAWVATDRRCSPMLANGTSAEVIGLGDVSGRTTRIAHLGVLAGGTWPAIHLRGGRLERVTVFARTTGGGADGVISIDGGRRVSLVDVRIEQLGDDAIGRWLGVKAHPGAELTAIGMRITARANDAVGMEVDRATCDLSRSEISVGTTTFRATGADVLLDANVFLSPVLGFDHAGTELIGGTVLATNNVIQNLAGGFALRLTPDGTGRHQLFANSIASNTVLGSVVDLDGHIASLFWGEFVNNVIVCGNPTSNVVFDVDGYVPQTVENNVAVNCLAFRTSAMVIPLRTNRFMDSATANIVRDSLRPCPGSPLLDFGMALPTVDHDRLGVSRPAGAGYSAGAFEVATQMSGVCPASW